MKSIIIFWLALCPFIPCQSQSVAINSDGSLPHSSAILDMKNQNKGLLIPRINLTSDTDVTTIPSPAHSLVVFNTSGVLTDGQGFYFWNGSKWNKLATSNELNKTSWGLSGNSNINPNTDFIGTTANSPLIFKTNNILAGKIAPGSSSIFFGQSAGLAITTGGNNSFFGHQAGTATTTGDANTGIGSKALFSNIDGSRNIAIGFNSLLGNTSGSRNIAIGNSSLNTNTSGNDNIANGLQALYSNSTGDQNIAIGNSALHNNTSGADNIAGGFEALYSNSTGDQNIAIGNSALHNNTSGTDNMAAGFEALYSNSTGFGNIAIGKEALRANSTGSNNIGIGVTSLLKNSNGIGNIGIGFKSMQQNLTGRFNTSVGYIALFSNTDGDGNTAIGNSALYENLGGANNTAVGSRAIFNNTTGSNNTAIGADAFSLGSGVTLSNTTMIGYQASVSTSNTMAFGNSSVDKWAFGISTTFAQHALQVGSTSGNGNGAYLTQGGNWTNASSAIKKEDFSDINGPELLQKIMQMPVQRWKYKGTNEYHIGPVAEDFYQLFRLGTDNKGISTADPAGIALAAIQEQQKIIEKQNGQIQQLQKRIEALEKK